MLVRFWGTRGSIATPGPETVRYGGNTSCVEVRSDSGTIVVLDCGTGARALGRALVAEEVATGRPLQGSILLGHTHWDHIQGLPFFEPLFRGGGRWDLYGPRGLGASLAQTLAGQMQYQYFPVSVDSLGAQVGYHDLIEGTFRIGDLVVRTQYLNHPALTLGYRIEGDGAVVVYLSDHELYDPDLASGGDIAGSDDDRRHVEFMAGADIAIHDTQYLASEYETRTGWGHSTMEYVVDAGVAAGVDRLVLFHHDPTRDDDAVDEVLARARERAADAPGTSIVAASEGLVLEARSTVDKRPAQEFLSAATTPAIEDLASSVVLATSDDALAVVVASAVEAEDLDLVRVGPDGDVAGALDEAGRSVLVLDLDDGDEVLARLQRAAPSLCSRLAILAVTRSRRGLTEPPPVVTDWMVWPASVSHVRTKLRAAVLRRACRWLAAPLPADEDQRLRRLSDLGILDTDSEDRFDRYTETACREFGVPIALITLVDRDRQWFKSRRGFDVDETHRDQSVCAHAILEPDLLQVPDLLADPRFAENPAVAAARARFYAGAPLVLADGSRVGTLCVVDHRPRLLTDGQLDRLRELAREVVRELEAADRERAQGAPATR